MKIVRSKNSQMRGRLIILPIVGKIQYNDKCEFEVANDADAKELVSIEELNLELVEDSRKETRAEEKARLKATPAPVEEKETEEEDETTPPIPTAQEKADFINNVSNMDELKELAAGFPIKEWEKIKSKAKLKEYLLSKI